MQYLRFFFHRNNGYANEPQYYVMPTLAVLLSLHQFSGSTVLRYTITNTDCASFIWRNAKRNAISAMVVMVPDTLGDMRRHINDKL